MQLPFNINILGKSSATPTAYSFPSSQLLMHNTQPYLLDCGEACQIRLRQMRLPMGKIRHIFISHVHGDHYFGLFGLLSTMDLMGRRSALHIFAPPKLKSLLAYVFNTGSQMPSYPIVFHDLKHSGKRLVLETRWLNVYAFPLKHGVSCYGFLFQEKQPPLKMRKDKILAYDLDVSEIRLAKQGFDVERCSERIRADEITEKPLPARSYAYCSDTAYYPQLAKWVEKVDVLYHEATFLEDMKSKPESYFHSTAADAAKIAAQAGVKKLLIGHFSTRYKDGNLFLEEARQKFPNTYIAEELHRFEVE